VYSDHPDYPTPVPGRGPMARFQEQEKKDKNGNVLDGSKAVDE
jgi:hypothetical protein